MDNYFDLNPYIDRILDVVLKYGGDRKVIFSTFHADACIMWGLPDVNDVFVSYGQDSLKLTVELVTPILHATNKDTCATVEALF